MGAAGLIAIGAALIVLGWGALLFGIGIGTVLASALLLGAGWAFFHSTMQSWATDVVPTARATAVSLFVASLFVGGAAGTALVAPPADRHAFGIIFLVALVLAAPLGAAAVAARSRYARR